LNGGTEVAHLAQAHYFFANSLVITKRPPTFAIPKKCPVAVGQIKKVL
jgi:hypothetical protein